MDLCNFKQDEIGCMMPEERDGFCIPHWRFKFGHEPTIEGLGDDAGKEVAAYCKRCRNILGSQTEDDACKAKMLNILVIDSKEKLLNVIDRLTNGRNIDDLLGAGAFQTLREGQDISHDKGLTGEEAKKILIDMLADIPPCADCGSRVCAEWLIRYHKWIMTAMLGPEGFMSMFIALLEREGGSIEFTMDELIKSRRVLKVENEVHTDGDRLRAVIVERAEDFPETEAEIGADHYWPDTIG